MNRDDIPSTEDFALRLSSQLEQNLNRSAGADAFFFCLGHNGPSDATCDQPSHCFLTCYPVIDT